MRQKEPMWILWVAVWVFATLVISLSSIAQTVSEVRGKILNSEDGRVLHGAILRVYPGNLVLISDEQGEYRISLPSTGKHRISVSHIGYQTRLLVVHTPPDTVLDISLSESPVSVSEIVVSATRSGIFNAESPVALEALTALDLDRINGTTLASAIAHSPGVYMKDYGGLSGLKTISLRGMGAEHTVVLLDGVRLNNFQNGLVDFGLFPIDQFERVEIVRGGNSALYGADAVGGVIQLIPKDHARPLKASFGAGLGTFGFKTYSLGVEHQEASFSVRGSFIRETGENDYRYFSSVGKKRQSYQRVNNNSDLQSRYLQVTHHQNKQSRLHAILQTTVAHRGVPGPILAGESGKAHQDDHDVLGLVSFRTLLGNRIHAGINANFRYSDLRYVDSAVVIGGKTLNSFSKTVSLGISTSFESSLGKNVILVGGTEIGRSSGESADLLKDFRRTSFGGFLSSEFSLFPLWPVLQRLTIYPSIRYDAFVDRFGVKESWRAKWSPRIGINMKILEAGEIHLRSSLGRSFRVPTFNDLYWTPGGNPNLRPEESVSFDIGFATSVSFLGKHVLEASYFHIDTKDRILWFPGSNAQIWSPKNVGRTRSTGLEIGIRSRFLNDILEVRFNETLTEARKKDSSRENDPTFEKYSVYVPREVTNASATLHLRPFEFTLRHQYVSHRFYTETNDRFLPAYRLTEANMMVSFSVLDVDASVKLEVNNLFNTEYQVIAFYPQPPRHYRLSIRLVN